MRHSVLALVMMAALTAGPAPGLAEDLTARSGGPSASEMMRRGGSDAADGLSFFRPVLSGVLYRAGFKGGDKGRTGLSQSQREGLCNAGMSKAFYADFGKNTDYGTTQCGGGSLDYAAARSSRPASVMKAVHAAIKNPSQGPVLVHCMWGVHSSGALSAMALVQFCGWSEDRAKQYWNEARNKAPCSGGCDKWIDAKFANFSVDPALTISAAEQAAICPK
ncbi:protein-tyrosine phosphatase family protein [Oceanomicrobium pacificus]|uniref:Tyrosine specific protein phosphatases domain-containing protein n=1 Tax=Oceanomicrobium pacificus TaxID=2692916 RepID=A0A6B0TYX2_9RHOB|nr:dual specificity protein phosphatase family protein [Oceanomicrobium pacificus]MXU66462.1 hypothetical protein [Oceanomicrobium pacificus]